MHVTLDCTKFSRGFDIFALEMSQSSTNPLTVEFKVTSQYTERLFHAVLDSGNRIGSKDLSLFNYFLIHMCMTHQI